MKIPLFDIDSTLLQGGNIAHRKAFEYACKKIYRIPASESEIRSSGMIDTEILIKILGFHGLGEEKVKQKIDKAMEAMEDYYHKNKNVGKSIVLEGVTELLDELREKSVRMGVLTGNVESIGWDKLERAGIKKYFSFGAFGSLAFKRSDLVEVARKRAEKVLARPVLVSDLIIVGDSPLDIACAREAGIKVIAVGTGKFPHEKLLMHRPDLLLKSLKEKEKFINFIT